MVRTGKLRGVGSGQQKKYCLAGEAGAVAYALKPLDALFLLETLSNSLTKSSNRK